MTLFPKNSWESRQATRETLKCIEDVMKAYEAQQDFFIDRFIDMANTTFVDTHSLSR